jgi:nitrogen fixation/metabolism regulation signal transduction histidine kinase
MAQGQSTETIKGVNPIAAIAIAIAIAFVMVLVTTFIFLRSSAYATVKQIQIGIQATEAMDQGDLDITSPINAVDIDQYATSINQHLDMIDDYADFGPEAVSDAQLGL